MLTKLTNADQLLVSLQQVKAQLRLDHADDDDHLIHLINSATAWVENTIGKCLLKQNWCQTWKRREGTIDGGLSGRQDAKRVFYLGKGPLLDIRSVTMVSADNQRMNIQLFTLHESEGRAHLRLKYPLPDSHHLEVVYSAGFGDRPDDVPPDLRQALLIYVSSLYEHRTGIDRADLLCLYGLLNPHRVMRLS